MRLVLEFSSLHKPPEILNYASDNVETMKACSNLSDTVFVMDTNSFIAFSASQLIKSGLCFLVNFDSVTSPVDRIVVE